MARFGISGLIVQENDSTRILNKQRVKSENSWCGNISFNFKKEAQRLASGRDSVHNYVSNLYKHGLMTLIEVTGFVSNGNPVLISELYPNHKEYFACFVKTGSSMHLLTLGSKTVQEFRAAGHDSFLKSRVPLILTINHESEQLEAVNLLPSLRIDELYSQQTKGVAHGTQGS